MQLRRISPCGAPGQRGIAMTMVMVIVVMMALIAGYVTQLGYNQRKLVDAASGRRAKIYYRAQAGLVDANARIRTNYTTGLSPAGSFAVDTYNPAPYNIDVDGDGTQDTTIDIDAVVSAALKNRPIRSAGCDGAVPCLNE